MATLTNTQISVTYVGLLKTSASTVLSSTAQQITDGSGNNSILFLSTAGVGIGGAASAGKEFEVTGNAKITGDLIVDNIKIDANTISAETGVVTLADGAIATTQSASDNSTKIATTAYVDAQVTAQDLDFSGDSGTGSVDLDSQTFAVVGTANEIETSAGSQQLQIGLPNDVTISNKLTVNTNLEIEDNHINQTSGDLKIESGNNIILDSDGDIIFKDNNATFATFENSSGNLILKSGSTTMLTGSGANSTFAGIIGVNGSTTANVPITATTSSGFEDVAYFKSAGTNINSRISLFPTGTGNGAINSASNNLLLQTSGADRVTISDTSATFAGSVVIGTSINTGIPFVVQKTTADGFAIGFMRNTNSTNGNGLVIDVNSTGGAYIQDWRQANSSKMRLLQNGNLGINETDSSNKLQISDSTVGTDSTADDSNFIKLTNKDIGTANEVWGLGFSSESGGTDYLGGFVQALGNFASNFNTSLIFGTRGTSGNAAERMRIDSSGNVGIGVTPSSGRMHIKGADSSNSSNGLFVENSSNGFTFAVRNDGEAVISNKLGIGVTSPIVPVHIVGTAVNNPSNGNGGYEVLQVFDDTSYATGVGGGIGLGGKFNSSGTDTIFSEIRGLKENATDGNFAGALTFSTRANAANITERARIDSSGNVGINETNPAVPLHISSDSASGENIALLLDNNNTTAGNEIGILFRSMAGSTNTDFEIFGKANGANDMDLVFQSDGSVERFRINSSGVVIIKNSQPSLKLDCTDTSLGVQTLSSIDFNQNDPSGTGAGAVARINAVNESTFQGAGALTFETGTSSTITERMRITSNGNVGIGTTTPSSTFQVGGGTANVLQKIHGSGTAGIQIFTNSPSTGTKIIALEQFFSNEGYLGLFSNGGESVRLRSNGTSFINGGFVGIGTTSPTGKLHIKDNGLTHNLIRLQHDGSGGNGFFDINVVSDAANLVANFTSTAIPMRFITGAAERMRITSTGDVDIGTNPRTAKLKVATGNADYVASLVSLRSSAVDCFGFEVKYQNATPNGTGNHFAFFHDSTGEKCSFPSNGGIRNFQTNNVNISDRRTKEDIKDAPNSLDILCKLKVRNYKLKNRSDERVNTGLIAQEVEEVHKELVNNAGLQAKNSEDTNDLKGIYNTDLMFMMLKSIQELKAEIETLKTQINK